MATKPTSLPRWATDPDRVVEPSAGEMDVGWEAGKKPPARKMNWLFAHLGDWISYIWEQLARVITANWFIAALPTSECLQGVAYSPTLDIFCAVGFQDGADADIVTSSDGLTWSEESNAKAVDLNDVVWGNGLFVGVGDSDGGDAYIVTSPDGSAWTECDNPKAVGLNAIAYSPTLGLFAAVGDSEDDDIYIVTSPDGSTWTERANNASARLRDIVWNPILGMFCAVGQGGSILTSTDGLTWTTRTPASGPGSASFSVVGLVGSRFVVTSDSGGYFQYSDNGVTWFDVGSVPLSAFRICDFEYCEELGICIGVGSGYVLESDDGENWTVVATPEDISMFGAAWSAKLGKFSVVGQNRAGNDAKGYASLAWPGIGG